MKNDDRWRGDTNTAIAFLRVSSRKQKDNTSHETQEKLIRDYCAEHDLDLVRLEKMVESAATSEKRKAYHAAQKSAMKEGIRHLLFYVSDRETRNLTDNEANEILVRQDKIVIHYTRDRQILHSKSSDSEFMMRDFLAVQNKQYIRNLRAKISDGMRTKAERGWMPLNHLPAGYIHKRMVDENGKDLKRGTTIIVDPDRRKVDRLLREFELRADGLSIAEIRKQIIAEGRVLPSEVKTYYKSGIEYRLKNRFYAGYFTWDGIEYKGKHPIIVPPELFRRVQQSFKTGGLKRRPRGIFGGGWVRCGQPGCGCALTYDPKKKKLKNGTIKTYEFYRCNNSKGVHDTMRGLNISEEKIWDQLGGALDRIQISDSLGKEIAQGLNKIEKLARGQQRKQAALHQDALTALEAKEDEAYSDLKAGLLSEDQYKRMVSKIRDQRSDYNVELARAQDAVTASYAKTATRIIELAIRAKSLWENRSPQERRELMEMVISNRQIEGGTLRYDLTNPFQKLVEIKRIQSGGADRSNIEPAVAEFRQAIIDWDVA